MWLILALSLLALIAVRRVSPSAFDTKNATREEIGLELAHRSRFNR